MNPYSLMNQGSRAEEIADLFLAIRDVITMNKLSNLKDYWDRDMSYRANGEQIKKLMAPNQPGFAFYWLESVRDDLIILKELNLIATGFRSRGPSGYGDDEEFSLTSKSLKIFQNKNRDEIKRLIKRVIMSHSINDPNYIIKDSAEDWVDDWNLPV